MRVVHGVGFVDLLQLVGPGKAILASRRVSSRVKTVTINRVDIVDKALEGLKKQVDAMKVLSSCVALVTRTVRPRNLNEETRTLNLVL